MCNISRIIISGLLSIVLTSCIKDIDFNQYEGAILTPTVVSNVLFSEVGASRFVDNGMELQTVMDSIANIEIFENNYINDDLVRAEFNFKVSNSVSRIFNLEVEFLNSNDELQHTLNLDVLPSSSGNDVLSTHTEVFENISIEALKMSTKIALTFTLLPSLNGTMLNENSVGRIVLQSSGTFFFNISI